MVCLMDVPQHGSASTSKKERRDYALNAADEKFTGRPPKLRKEVEEDLIAENQRLRVENDYLVSP